MAGVSKAPMARNLAGVPLRERCAFEVAAAHGQSASPDIGAHGHTRGFEKLVNVAFRHAERTCQRAHAERRIRQPRLDMPLHLLQHHLSQSRWRQRWLSAQTKGEQVQRGVARALPARGGKLTHVVDQRARVIHEQPADAISPIH